ncbi:major histocompatibility complex class I-related gene protein-like [Odontesthes bonariensis]|uniref:major histocompatibility complex class I-related protein 1-like n=1 Tax=Odontesthes bonariensis TaxID=219752 RepID=UPI003F58D11A
MMGTKKPLRRFIAFLLICQIASPAPHSLTYILTATSGISDFPEFFGSVVFDDVQLGGCNSNKPGLNPSTSWMGKLLEDIPSHQEWLINKCLFNRESLRANIESLKQRFNQSEGVHIFQRMNGCHLDEETGDFNGFSQFGYDGEDLIRFDLKTETWITPKRQAVLTKHDWERDGHRSLFWKIALTEECRDLLKMYLKYTNDALQKTVFPSVSLLQKTPSSPVSCHATGFYPNRALMFWRRDGEEIHEGVDHGEILPNDDGTFQMTVDLQLHSLTPEDWTRFDCVFQFSSFEGNITSRLDKAIVRTNSGSSRIHFAAVIGAVVTLVCVAGLFIKIWSSRR